MSTNSDNRIPVDLFDALCTTRAIRRYKDELVPASDVNRMLFAATRAPSGSNRQPFRFVVLDGSPPSEQARSVLGDSARKLWAQKYLIDGYGKGSGLAEDSPKFRVARTMQEYVDNFESSPVVILPCLVQSKDHKFSDGASIYPACQNLLLAARIMGYGGVMTSFNREVDKELRSLLSIPDDVVIAATITLGHPRGRHGPVRRRPLSELVFEGSWGHGAPWAEDLLEWTS